MSRFQWGKDEVVFLTPEETAAIIPPPEVHAMAAVEAQRLADERLAAAMEAAGVDPAQR